MKKRAGKTAIFSISVDEETRKFLRTEAERSHGGNVSALIVALAEEAKRQAAIAWLLARPGVPKVPRADREAFLAEIDGKPAAKKKRRRSAA